MRRAGILVDRLLVFGTQPGPAVEALAQDVGVTGMPDGVAEDVDQDGEQPRSHSASRNPSLS